MQIDSSTKNYIEILEKTNQQLSLWYNPYGILVGVLAVLIGLLAIMFAFILWRQGKEYKDAFRGFLDEQKKFADGELKNSISEAKTVLDSQIESYKEKLKDIKDLKGKAAEDLEKEIKKLKSVRETLEKPSPKIMLGGNGGTVGGGGGGGIISGSVGNILAYNQGTFRTIAGVANMIRCCARCGFSITSDSPYCPNCGFKL